MHNQEQNPAILRHVAQNLRQTRIARGLSQVALAEASGISRRLIVDVEAGQANVSLSSLDKLASALGVGFVELVAEPGRPRTQIRETTWRGADGSLARLLGAAPAQAEAQIWEWTLAAGDHYQAEPDPAGWHEMIYVVAGALRLVIDGVATSVPAGDFTIFPSSQHYSYHNDGPDLLRFIRNVVS
ncbi:XRE family transcriptional regulator [Paracoccus litorisediminis]|uniref:Helix-turn-helix domain-containing protein n=1 Tax=Paracoccus litorisediminis TaxID=2006130 RepID=A0A844HPH5_9RHOB|nr:XRE family transcriptional regulator [Paracoccus litorisediminis]MTH61029.1 helix-turn-helix domain-containing protein [Paracoccus litorisediminis]